MKRVFKATLSVQLFLLLGCFVAFWTVYPVLTQVNLDRYGDMLENFSWGIAWQAGYFKHPPLFAWITAAWFSILPRADWAYYLLSALNSMVAVWASWRIALRFLSPWRAFLSAALFFFLPPVTFLAIKYNANAAMLPLWPLTVLLYIRFLEGRKAADAVLLGLVAAAAVLAKYFSAVLLAAICLHVLFDREARQILWRPPVWIAVAAFAIVLAPHAIWLFHNDFLPVSYAAEQGDGSPWAGLVSTPHFIGALLLYALPAALILLLTLWRNKATSVFEFRQVDALRQTVEGRALLWTTFVPLVLVIVLAIIFSAELSSVWALPMFSSVPILLLLLVPPQQLEAGRAVVPVAAAVYCAVLLAVSPLVRQLTNQGYYAAVPVHRIAVAIEGSWAAHTDAPLAIVAGDKILASGASFYAPSRPYSIQDNSLRLTPWVTAEDIKHKGLLVACFKGQSGCEKAAKQFPVQYAAREDITVPGLTPGKEWSIRLFIAPPEEQALARSGFDDEQL